MVIAEMTLGLRANVCPPRSRVCSSEPFEKRRLKVLGRNRERNKLNV